MGMELRVLGSSSSGNCYILDNGNEALIIEAGIGLCYAGAEALLTRDILLLRCVRSEA